MIRFFLIIISLSLLGVELVSGQNEWQKYLDPNGKFEVFCPGGLMQMKEQEVVTELGHLKNTAYFIQMDNPHPNHLYMITTIDYPKGAFPKDSLSMIEEFFEEVLISLEQNTNTKEQYHQMEVTAQTKEMISRLISLDGKTSIKARVLLKDDILYTLQAYTNHSNKLNDFLDQFIDSFKLL